MRPHYILLISLTCLAVAHACDQGSSGTTATDTSLPMDTHAEVSIDETVRTPLDVTTDLITDLAHEVSVDSAGSEIWTDILPTDGMPSDTELVDTTADLPADDVGTDSEPVDPPFVWPVATGHVGGDRPAPFWVPTDYDPDDGWPLVLLLHGFGANGFLQNGLFHLSPQVDDLGILLVVPEGTTDSDGDQFWDAGWCCNWDGIPLDDVGYLVGLVDEMAALYNVDPGRVYAMGHSNGGFMAYRLACEVGDRFTAIVSLAGAQFKDPAACTPSEPVGVLQVHGTEDANVPYGGGNKYVSAWDSAVYWAQHNGCGEPQEGVPFDLDLDVEGPETLPSEWADCPDSLRVALWTLQGVAHTPSIYDGTFAKLAVEFLLTQSKP